MTDQKSSRRTLVLVILIAGIGFGIYAEYLSARGGMEESQVIDMATGLSFLTAGAIASIYRSGNRIGPLMAATGFFWFIGNLQFSSVPDLAAFGLAFQGYEALLITHVVLAYPTGQIRSKLGTASLAGGYVIAAIANLVEFANIEAGPGTCPTCPASIRLGGDEALATLAINVGDMVPGIVVLVAVYIVVRRIRSATNAQWTILAPLWIAASVAGLSFAVATLAGLEVLGPPLSIVVNEFVSFVTMLIPISFTVGLLRSKMSVSGMGQLIIELEANPTRESLKESLARTLHDPALEIVYWISDREGYVDERGLPVDLPANDSRAVTLVQSGGERLAAILHDPVLSERSELVEAASAAMKLALEREKLQAELRAQLIEVRESRARIVQASDEARRRIERDLHDGAQQRLLSVALSLNMAKARLPSDVDPAIHNVWDEASEELKRAIFEVRDLAQGIHPAILTEQGLGPAIEMIVEKSPVPVTVDIPRQRYPSQVEAAAYYVVAEALSNIAKYSQARRASVRVHMNISDLLLQIEDDGIGGADPSLGTGLRGLQDRVSSAGGRLQIESPPGRGTTLIASIPIAV